MDYINAWLQNPIINMVVAAFVGWLVTKWLDQRPDAPPASTPAPVSAAADALTRDDIEDAVARAVRRNSKPASQESEHLAMLIVGVISLAATAAVVTYGEIAINAVQFVVGITGASAITLAIRGYKFGLFTTEARWSLRILLLLLICCVCFFVLDQAQATVAATITQAQRQGIRIRSVPRFFEVFGSQTSWYILYTVLALIVVIATSAIALLVQFGMVMNALVARNPSMTGWRRSLWRGLRNWPSAASFVFMVMLSLLAVVLSSGWLLSWIQHRAS